MLIQELHQSVLCKKAEEEAKLDYFMAKVNNIKIENKYLGMGLNRDVGKFISNGEVLAEKAREIWRRQYDIVQEHVKKHKADIGKKKK